MRAGSDSAHPDAADATVVGGGQHGRDDSSPTAPRRSTARMLAVWTRQEILLLAREPVAVFFSLVFPLVVYLFIGSPYADQEVQSGVRFIDVMFPALVGTVSTNLLLMGMPVYVAELRARGVDRRYRVIPLPGGVLGAAILGAMLLLVALGSAVVVVVVALAHGLRPEAASPAFLVSNLLLVAWLCCAGYFLGSLPLGTRTTQAMTAAVFFVLFFGSGAAAPLGGLPAWVQTATQFNPLRHWFDWLISVYAGTEPADGTLWKALAVLPIAAILALISAGLQRRAIS